MTRVRTAPDEGVHPRICGEQLSGLGVSARDIAFPSLPRNFPFATRPQGPIAERSFAGPRPPSQAVMKCRRLVIAHALPHGLSAGVCLQVYGCALCSYGARLPSAFTYSSLLAAGGVLAWRRGPGLRGLCFVTCMFLAGVGVVRKIVDSTLWVTTNLWGSRRRGEFDVGGPQGGGSVAYLPGRRGGSGFTPAGAGSSADLRRPRSVVLVHPRATTERLRPPPATRTVLRLNPRQPYSDPSGPPTPSGSDYRTAGRSKIYVGRSRHWAVVWLWFLS